MVYWIGSSRPPEPATWTERPEAYVNGGRKRVVKRREATSFLGSSSVSQWAVSDKLIWDIQSLWYKNKQPIFSLICLLLIHAYEQFTVICIIIIFIHQTPGKHAVYSGIYEAKSIWLYDLGLLEHGVYPDVQNPGWLMSIGNYTIRGSPINQSHPITIKRLSVEHQEHDDEPVDGMRLRGSLILDKPMVYTMFLGYIWYIGLLFELQATVDNIFHWMTPKRNIYIMYYTYVYSPIYAHI